MCQVLDVSENGYYNWYKRGKSKRKWDDEQLAERIEDAYQESRGKYGSPRIHAKLQAQGIQNGAKTDCSVNARKKSLCTKKETESANNEQSPSVFHRFQSSET
jgi:putative transposase